MLKAKQTWTIEMVNYELINTTVGGWAPLGAHGWVWRAGDASSHARGTWPGGGGPHLQILVADLQVPAGVTTHVWMSLRRLQGAGHAGAH